MPNIVIPGKKSRSEIALNAMGLLWESDSPGSFSSTGNAITSQLVIGRLAGLRAGDVVTGIALKLPVAAAGTAPTTARFGLADSTGKVLVLSGNLNAASNWTLGTAAFPFTAPYTVPADGGYYACWVVNGTWGTTQPTVAKCQTANAASFTAFGSNVALGFQWSGQTDLPAVGSSLTVTSGISVPLYTALY